MKATPDGGWEGCRELGVKRDRSLFKGRSGGGGGGVYYKIGGCGSKSGFTPTEMGM